VRGMVHQENAGRGLVGKHRATRWSKKAASSPVAVFHVRTPNIPQGNREFLHFPDF